MKAFSPAQIKADILFLLSVIAVFSANLTNTQTIALLGASGLIAAVANFAEAHIHVGASITNAVERVLTEVRALLPAINMFVTALPGQVGSEVKKVLETVEKGRQAGEAVAGGKAKEATSTAGKAK